MHVLWERQPLGMEHTHVQLLAHVTFTLRPYCSTYITALDHVRQSSTITGDMWNHGVYSPPIKPRSQGFAAFISCSMTCILQVMNVQSNPSPVLWVLNTHSPSDSVMRGDNHVAMTMIDNAMQLYATRRHPMYNHTSVSSTTTIESCKITWALLLYMFKA